MKVRDAMTRRVASVRPDVPFRRIVRTLREQRISGMPVVDGDGRVVGVVSESDLVPKEHRGHPIRLHPPFASHGVRAFEERVEGMTAHELMTSPAVTISEDAELRAGARLLSMHGIGRIPVTRHGRLVGILTRGDVLAAFLRSDEEIRAEIEDEVLRMKVREDTSDVRVEVNDGVVTLEGVVQRHSTARLIAFHVNRIDGVAHVENRIDHYVDDLVRARRASAS